MIHVLPKSHKQFTEQFGRKQGFRQIVNINDLFGLFGGKIIILSGAESRRDFSQILDYVESAGFEVVRATF